MRPASSTLVLQERCVHRRTKQEEIMKTNQIAIALVAMAAAASAHAELSSTWTLASDYDFRGITQTAQDPAIQASIDYAHDNGWYAGAWASNVDFCASTALACLDADYEVDLYTGFTGSTGAGGLGWDAGLVYYAYEESDYNYPEIYAALSKDWFKAKASYSNDFGGDATTGDTPAFYVEANAAPELGGQFTLLAHVGYSFGDYWDDLDAAGAGGEYVDYSIGVGYGFKGINFALKWVDGSDLEESDGTPEDVFTSEARVVLTIATTLPRQ
jgi:uncharacterized protein (TIGR02001 family)